MPLSEASVSPSEKGSQKRRSSAVGRNGSCVGSGGASLASTAPAPAAAAAATGAASASMNGSPCDPKDKASPAATSSLPAPPPGPAKTTAPWSWCPSPVSSPPVVAPRAMAPSLRVTPVAAAASRSPKSGGGCCRRRRRPGVRRGRLRAPVRTRRCAEDDAAAVGEQQDEDDEDEAETGARCRLRRPSAEADTPAAPVPPNAALLVTDNIFWRRESPGGSLCPSQTLTAARITAPLSRSCTRVT
mmetsp:Transcript_8330/g.20681  ORF Transcript_8330/g.20681 Transcript_8330/m.20681 type:complete len:244 (+) Transcript_8330:1737-2468(+)